MFERPTTLAVVLAGVLLFASLLATLGAAGLTAGSARTQVARIVSAAAECEFRLGFRAFHALVPMVVGECLGDERHNLENGDGLQPTTNGLLVWRKADNWTAFTDGSTTWVSGPRGLQSRPNGERFGWELGVSEALPVTAATPTPGSDALVQLAIADAAQRAGVDRAQVQLLRVEARQWSDSSLGCPRPGYLYLQVITPGFLILLEVDGGRLEYHTDTRQRLEVC